MSGADALHGRVSCLTCHGELLAAHFAQHSAACRGFHRCLVCGGELGTRAHERRKKSCSPACAAHLTRLGRKPAKAAASRATHVCPECGVRHQRQTKVSCTTCESALAAELETLGTPKPKPKSRPKLNPMAGASNGIGEGVPRVKAYRIEADHILHSRATIAARLAARKQASFASMKSKHITEGPPKMDRPERRKRGVPLDDLLGYDPAKDSASVTEAEYTAQLRIERMSGLYDPAEQDLRRRKRKKRDAEAEEIAAAEAGAARHLVSDADRR